jgi:hypothetical protein
MEPFDIALIAVIVIVVACGLWLLANSQRHTSGTMDFIATWLATSLIVFIIGGGLAMFGVAVILFMLGREAASVGLVLLAIGLVLEPFVVLLVLRYRRTHTVNG